MKVPVLERWRDFCHSGTRVFSNAQLREADQASAHSGLPSLLLMEQAAMQICRYLELCPEPFLLLIGPGNNGGDGLALARLLLAQGRKVDIWCENIAKGDINLNYQFLKAESFEQYSVSKPPPWSQYRCVVDCLFGTGLSRCLEQPYFDLLTHINRLQLLRIAVDIPSGLRGDSPAVDGVCFQAHATIALCSLRMAHLLYPAASYCGVVHLVPLSISQSILDHHFLASKDRWRLLGPQELELPKRRRDSHKGHYGHVLLVGGSSNSSGALRLAAYAALRSGVGLLSLASEAELKTLLLSDLPEAQWFELTQQPHSWPGLEKYSALAIGPGWGRTDQRRWLLEQLLQRFTGPVVLDADALFALAQTPESLSLLKNRTLLTPHIGEFSTLIGLAKQETALQRYRLASEYAKSNNITLLLKSSDTLLCNSDGEHWIMNRGNEALARGGSGDMLAGLAAGLLAQGLTTLKAAQLASWTLGAAAEHSALSTNKRCFTSTTLLKSVTKIFDQLEGMADE